MYGGCVSVTRACSLCLFQLLGVFVASLTTSCSFPRESNWPGTPGSLTTRVNGFDRQIQSQYIYVLPHGKTRVGAAISRALFPESSCTTSGQHPTPTRPCNMLPSMITLPFTFSSLVSRNASSVESVTISYDTAYDDFSAQVTNLACSSNLTNLGFTNLGSIPGFPYIGGSSAVSSSGSTGCITCWELSYNETNINVLVVDYADEGLNIAQAAMNGLTGGDAQELGILWATAVEVDVTECGM